MTKDLYINLDPDSADAFGDISEALKDTIKRFDSLNKTVLKAERQLLKFDEINRLVAYEVKEKEASSGRSSSGGSSKSSSAKKAEQKKEQKKASEQGAAKAGNAGKSAKGETPKGHEATLPMYFTIKDVFFNRDDLNWEQIAMKLMAGLCTVAGGLIGFQMGGVPGAIIGIMAGLMFGIAMDETIFNFDGELQKEEIWNCIKAALPPIAGAMIGFFVGGPLGAFIGVTLGLSLSFLLIGTNWTEFTGKLDEFFEDLILNFRLRWDSFERLVQESFAGIKTWWHNLSLGKFPFKVPHLIVEWQELSSDSILAKFLGITAIPHLSVQWYARGGIVDGPTLIGAGEAGKEAIIPLERNTGWIRMVAEQIVAELEKLAPAGSISLVSLPEAASGALVPPSAAAPSAPLDLGSLADTIANAIASAGQSSQSDPVIRVYLDGKQLTDVVTKYQRRNERAFG